MENVARAGRRGRSRAGSILATKRVCARTGFSWIRYACWKRVRKTAPGIPIHFSFLFWIYRSRGDRELGAYHFLRQQKNLSRSLFFLPFLAERQSYPRIGTELSVGETKPNPPSTLHVQKPLTNPKTGSIGAGIDFVGEVGTPWHFRRYPFPAGQVDTQAPDTL